MAIGIELARVIGPLTPFPRKVLNAQAAIRDKNRHINCAHLVRPDETEQKVGAENE